MKRLLAAAVLVGVAGGLGAAAWLGRMSVDLGPAGVVLAWDVSPKGATVLAFPPFGEVTAATHAGPGRLRVILERIDLDSLRDFVNSPPEARERTVDAAADRALSALELFAVRLLATAAIGGAIAWRVSARALRLRPEAATIIVAGAAGCLAVAGVVGLARATYDVNAFRSPVYSGALEAVPWLMETVDEAILRVEELDQRLRALSASLYRMYERVESLPPSAALEAADVTVLHVTDFHNHPSAAGIAAEIARSFGVDFIVNTGDLTDFGTLFEAELLAGLEEIGVPHYFVSGNHETPPVIERIEALGSITVLDGRLVEEQGLLIAGLPDPGASRESAESLTPVEATSHAAAINERLRAMAERPDILALHNFRTAQGVAPGLVPAVLFGHSHTPGVQFRSGTAYVNAGTTGGAGVRGVEASQEVPITLAVVYFERLDAAARRDEAAPEGGAAEGGEAAGRFRTRVIAVDILRLSPVAGGFTLERHLAPR